MKFCRPCWSHDDKKLTFPGIQKGPVRGISLKLQEEERERRMDYVPEKSEVDVDRITVDPDTKEMLKELNMADLPIFTTTQAAYQAPRQRF